MSAREWYKILNKSPETAEVRIYDQIGGFGITADRFAQDLGAITAKQITLRINSLGGEVFDGLAIYNAIRNHPATVNVEIDGIAASIASVIACAGDSVSIAKNAFMMVHNVMSGCFGYAADLRKEADVCDKLSLSVADAYVDRTGKTLQEIQKAMGDETWFDGAEAKAFGLVDSIMEEDPDEGDDPDQDDPDEQDAQAFLVKAALKFKNTPEKLRRFAASLVGNSSRNPKSKEPVVAKLNIIERDGKKFVKVGDEEHELIVHGMLEPAQPQNQAPGATAPADLEKVRAAAVAEEREYAKNFRAILTAGGITGKEADEFEKTFYSRALEDVKFLASHAIGQRAKPLGEGGGDQTKTPAAELEEKAIARFAAELDLRKLFGVGTYDESDSAVYKAGLKRFLSGEARWHADEAAGKHQKAVKETK